MRLFNTIILSLCVCILASLPLQGGVPPVGRVVLEMLRKTSVKKPAIPRVKRTGYMYEVGMTSTPAKRALNAQLKYHREIQQAGHLYERIQRTPLLSLRSQELQQDIEGTIVNKTLRKSLLAHLEKRYMSAMLTDLENYYHLAPDYFPTFYATMAPAARFARDALAYLQQHPYKPNWPLRYILKTEGMDPALKKTIQNIVNKGIVPADQVDRVLQLLQTAYEQYQRILKDSATDENVEATVAIYKYLANELEAFTTENQRPPMFQRENEYERDLFNLISVLVYHHESNIFEQVIPHLYRLYDLLERFPLPRYEEADTLRELTKFIEQYNDLPKGVHMRDILQPRPQEDMLYESILYWQRNSPAFQEQINNLILRKTTKTEYLPRPFNYY